MQQYTIGEIYRLGLLKNHKGQPYTSKGTISKVVRNMPRSTKPTPWGQAIYISQNAIDEHNDQQKTYQI